MRAELFGYAYHHWAPALDRLLENAGVDLPLSDQDAYLLYPQYRWMFNKLLLSEAQGLPAYPHGVEPGDVGIDTPVFSKPITNLWGLSTGAEIIEEWRLDRYRAGHMWMPLLPDPQLSTDVVVCRGEIVWWYSMRPVTNAAGSFIRWETEAVTDDIANAIRSWVARHLRDFSGVANFETRGPWIIDATPRMSVQFLDFYGEGWLDSVAALYRDQTWRDVARPLDRGVSEVIRVDRRLGDRRLTLRDPELLAKLERQTGTSVYLPWRNGQRLADANDDDRSFRIALINGWSDASIAQMATLLSRLIIGLPAAAWPGADSPRVAVSISSMWRSRTGLKAQGKWRSLVPARIAQNPGSDALQRVVALVAQAPPRTRNKEKKDPRSSNTFGGEES